MRKTVTVHWIGRSANLVEFRCYSAYEYSLTVGTASQLGFASSRLPLDIVLEALTSVLLICIGLVMITPNLQPIIFRVWAGEEEKITTGGVYRGLEERPGFIDVRLERKRFAEWVRNKGNT